MHLPHNKTAKAFHSHRTYVAMRKNGSYVGFLTFGKNAAWCKLTETATVHLSKGDNMYVMVFSGSGTHILASGLHSNFSGFLVKAD